jgi:hypothetical protein
MRRSATVFSRGEGRNKTWWARLNYVDEATGKRRDRQRRAESYVHAKELAEQLAKEFDETAGRSIDAERMSFAELADYCEKHYYKAAGYHDERKVAGVRGRTWPRLPRIVFRVVPFLELPELSPAGSWRS